MQFKKIDIADLCNHNIDWNRNFCNYWDTVRWFDFFDR